MEKIFLGVVMLILGIICGMEGDMNVMTLLMVVTVFLVTLGIEEILSDIKIEKEREDCSDTLKY